jgi:hypothetical protein
MYVLRIVRMVKSAARPGVLELPVVSSLMVSVVEPTPRKADGEFGRPANRFAEGQRDEEGEDDHLQPHEYVLDPFRRRHATVGNSCGAHQENQGSQDVHDRLAAQCLDGRVPQDVPEQQVEERDRHAHEVGEYDNRCQHEAPPAHPADVRAEGLNRPRERGAAVRRLMV